MGIYNAEWLRLDQLDELENWELYHPENNEDEIFENLIKEHERKQNEYVERCELRHIFK